MHSLIDECNRLIELRKDKCLTDEDDINELEYQKMRKSVLTEAPFLQGDLESQEIFKIVKSMYSKLIWRCPLYKIEHATRSDINPINNHNKGFVKIDLSKDNLGRSMRLKLMKKPLKDPSVVKGILYCRQFLLKRFMLANFMRQHFIETYHNIMNESKLLIPNELQHKLFKVLIQRIGFIQSINRTINKKIEPTPNMSPEKIKRSASRLYDDFSNIMKKSALFMEAKFRVEIIKIDRAIFGKLSLTENLLRFEHMKKETTNSYYRTSSTLPQVPVLLKNPKKKCYKLDDLRRVIVRYYNMIKQAAEITFIQNNKSIFIVFFNEAKLSEFITTLKRVTNKCEIIEDPHKEFLSRKYTEDWRKGKISNFEYLMILNDFSSRSYNCLSQYPVFPWILQNYASKLCELKETDFRDLHYPIAGITEKKRIEAIKKFENTDDLPGGRFQYGSHYLPGLAVLGYLMRLQPYTLMHHDFNAGGDCPTRLFHFINVMWQHVNEQSDTNLELLSEHFFNPEVFSNLYFRLYNKIGMQCHLE